MNRYDVYCDVHGRRIRLGWQAEDEEQVRKEAKAEGWQVVEVKPHAEKLAQPQRIGDVG